MTTKLAFFTTALVLLPCFPAVAQQATPQRNPERDAYFGETHIHTSWSVDAWIMGNRLTGPGEALKYQKTRGVSGCTPSANLGTAARIGRCRSYPRRRGAEVTGCSSMPCLPRCRAPALFA
jgi:Protein of unknown function (DUF3604)